jgi:hypothetical protein
MPQEPGRQHQASQHGRRSRHPCHVQLGRVLPTQLVNRLQQVRNHLILHQLILIHWSLIMSYIYICWYIAGSTRSIGAHAWSNLPREIKIIWKCVNSVVSMTLCVFVLSAWCLLLEASMYALGHLNKLRYIWYCYVLLLYFVLFCFVLQRKNESS